MLPHSRDEAPQSVFAPQVGARRAAMHKVARAIFVRFDEDAERVVVGYLQGVFDAARGKMGNVFFLLLLF